MTNTLHRLARLSLIILLFSLLGCQQPGANTSLLARPFNSTQQLEDHFLVKQNAVVPFRARGKGRIEFIENSGKLKKEQLEKVDIFYQPQEKLYVNFDHFLQKKAIRFGSTSTEFWCWVKMSEINDYYYGSCDSLTLNCPLPYGLSPESIMEAFGVLQLKSVKSADLSHEDAYEILTISDQFGRPAKKYFIDVYDRNLKRIEHFDKQGDIAVIFSMNNYRLVSDGFNLYIPGNITINSLQNNVTIYIDIDKIENLQVDETRSQKLFGRPQPVGAKNIFWLSSDCNFIKLN